jgi:putative phosphoesterase
MKIGVIADTHLRTFSEMQQELIRVLSKVDLIVHAGDIVTLDIIRGLETLAPVRAVCGNMDLPEVKSRLPETHVFEEAGRRIGIVHGSGSPRDIQERIGQLFHGVDVVIFGHTHVPANKMVGKTLFFNPGSAAYSYGLINIGDKITAEIKKTIFKGAL